MSPPPPPPSPSFEMFVAGGDPTDASGVVAFVFAGGSVLGAVAQGIGFRVSGLGFRI
jgi:hypothetical protein